MILYFDTFITEVPLLGGGRNSLKEDVRKNCPAYAMPKKLEIAKYSLASYALYPWSNVFIRYELENAKGYKDFDRYILHLFPGAIILHERSDSQKDYQKSLKILDKMNDDWIFYAPNNDDPLITSDKKIVHYIDKLIKKAEKFKKKYKFVSVLYSHFTEYINLPIKGTPINIMLGRNVKVVEEDNYAVSCIFPKGYFGSIQIIDKYLFRHWFATSNLNGRRIIRAEDLEGYVEIKDHLIITPKKEICAHFDEYEFTIGSPNEIQTERIPPLFIPKGFFINNIKIAYGYDKYRQGWVNINPKAKEYSFRDNKYGTDLKICLEDIPLFWKNHIKEIDINKDADLNELKNYRDRNFSFLLNPWSNLEINVKTIRFYMRLTLYKILLILGVIDIIRPIQKKHRSLYYLLHKISI
ncbi:MAG: hypothetical protein Q7K55_02370 [Candidatus Levybacteria bacterium]|nr:hypothetical protein [Candidatus Levybacteria bacterium]